MIVKDPTSTLLPDSLYGSSFPWDVNLLVHPGQLALTVWILSGMPRFPIQWCLSSCIFAVMLKPQESNLNVSINPSSLGCNPTHPVTFQPPFLLPTVFQNSEFHLDYVFQSFAASQSRAWRPGPGLAQQPSGFLLLHFLLCTRGCMRRRELSPLIHWLN